MAGAATIAGILSALVFAAAVIYAVRSGGLLSGSEDPNQDVGRDELAVTERRDEWEVPMLKRYKAWPASYRIAVAVIAGFFLLWVVGTYQLLKGGTTIGGFESPYAYAAAGAVVGGVGLVRLKKWSDDQVRSLDIIYEEADGDRRVEEIKYKSGSERVTPDGTRVVKEVVDNRIAGLFWRYKQIAQRRELRGHRKLPEDVVEIGIPDHAVQVPSGYVVRSSSDGKRIVDGPASIDLTVGSPEQMSYPRAMEIRRENRQLRVRAEARSSEAAELQRQLTTLQTKVQNQEYREREDLIDDIKSLSEPVQRLKSQPQPQPTDGTNDNPARQQVRGNGGGEQ